MEQEALSFPRSTGIYYREWYGKLILNFYSHPTGRWYSLADENKREELATFKRFFDEVMIHPDSASIHVMFNNLMMLNYLVGYCWKDTQRHIPNNVILGEFHSGTVSVALTTYCFFRLMPKV